MYADDTTTYCVGETVDMDKVIAMMNRAAWRTDQLCVSMIH